MTSSSRPIYSKIIFSRYFKSDNSDLDVFQRSVTNNIQSCCMLKCSTGFYSLKKKERCHISYFLKIIIIFKILQDDSLQNQQCLTLWNHLCLTAVPSKTGVKSLGPKPALLEMTEKYTLHSNFFLTWFHRSRTFSYMHFFLL